MKPEFKRKVLASTDPADVRKFIKYSHNRLRDIGSEAKAQSQGFREQADLHQRRELLRRLELSVIQKADAPLRMFVSYTRTGSHIAAQAEEIASERNIEVVFGLSHIKDEKLREQILADGSRVRPIIKENIMSCDMFLGIWTADFAGREVDGRDLNNNEIVGAQGLIPGVWMPLEFGIAMASNLSFEILLELGIHRSVYEKALGDWRGRPFKPADFRPALIEAINELQAKALAKLGRATL